MKIKYFITLPFVFLCLHSYAQEPQETWVLNSQETGTKTYVARESISLKAGFKYANPGNSFTAKIDPMLLFPPTENTYLKPDGTITSDPALGGVVGAIPGAFDVSPTGAATYSVPIECPAGINGMQPNVSLVYNSQGGNGIAGMCWNISGLSMISRAPKNYYHDNERSGIIWDNTSPLVLDGQRLITVNTWGTDSIEYRTESGLDRIVGYTIKPWGPLTFKVYTKDGKILEYGNTTMVHSYFPVRLNNTNIGTATAVNQLGWALTRIIDVNNNYIDFTYTSDQTSSSGYYNYTNVRISSISYGNHTGGTKETVGKLDFLYTDRTHPYTTYIDGMETSNKYLLDKVQIRGMNNLLTDTYEISYTTQDRNDFLVQVKKVNTSGEFIHPLKFDWSPVSYTVSDTTQMIFKDYNNYSYYMNHNGQLTRFEKLYGDINGDGLTDVIAKVTYSFGSTDVDFWVVFLKIENSNEYQYIYEQVWDKDNETVFLLADLEHEGKDKLYIGKYNADAYFNNFEITCYSYDNTAVISSLFAVNHIIADVNNRKDHYFIPGDFLGNGNPQILLFGKNNRLLQAFGLTYNIILNPIGGGANSRVYLTDINGNGKTEIMYVHNNTTTFYEHNGFGRFDSIYTCNFFNNKDKIHVGDFNGDGYTDILAQKNTSSYANNDIWISNGNSLIQTNWGNSIVNSTQTLTETNTNITYTPDILLMDINQDGKTDIISFDLTGSIFPPVTIASRLRIFTSTGNGFEQKTSVVKPVLNFSIMHFPGTGRYNSVSDKGIITKGSYKDFFFNQVTICDNVQFNKMTGITDGLNNQTTITYGVLNTPDNANINPYSYDFDTNLADDKEKGTRKGLSAGIEVVKNVSATNVNNDYEFHGTQIHWQARGFLGFDSIRVIDKTRLINQVAENKRDETYHLLYPYRNRVETDGGTLISESKQFSAIENAGTGNRYFLKQDSVVSTDVLQGIAVKTSYSNYDAERNPQTIKTDYGNGITSTDSLTYVSKGSLFLNKIASRQTTQKADGQTDAVRKEYFLYDNKGNPIYHVADSTDVNKVQTVYGNYDKYGNPGKITTTANGVSRSQTLTYSTSGRFIKTKKDDQINQTLTYNYDESRGLLTSKADRMGTTTYQYDNFGRLKWTTYPDGIKTTNTIQWAGTIPGKPASAKYYTYSETSGQSPVWVWYDAQGREIRRDSYGLNNKKVLVETEYNAKGKVYRVSEPYFENTAKTWAATYTYDRFGRDSTVLTPMGTTAYAYSGLATTVTSPTGTRKTTVNQAGWVVEEETNGKKVNFSHYASGLVKTATPEGGPSISTEYDLQGNRTRLTDPDAGVITSNYDGWGQLLRNAQKVHLTGDSIVTTYNYLPSGLLQQKTLNGETTNYGYDNLYRLNRVSIAGKHAQGFVYDTYDRIIQSKDTVENSKFFVRSMEYDKLGRVAKETYPGGYNITNQYDKYSYLTGVIDMNRVNIWSAVESNAKGQLTKSSQGGRTTTFGFDSRGFPTSITNPSIVNMAYSFTSKGNLDYRQDNLTGYKETFTYDPLNRLTNWTIYLNNVQQATNSLSYNSTTGLINAKSDLNNYALNYGEDGQPPHALTSIAGIPDLIQTDQSITYTDFKKLKQLTQGDDTLNISYGADRQRVKSVLTQPDRTLTRYYMGNYEEEVFNGNTRKIHYICGGNGLTAIYVQNAGQDTLYFVHTDYQGSLIALSLPNGTVKERYAFDPWGNRRDPANWTQADMRTDFVFNRGYTFHEHLPEFKLINMNGRVYDPLTSQFLSLDPFVQSPGDWLNYNRYAYAMNNPLLYIDPSGELFFFIIPSISYSKEGGWDFSLTAGLGIPNICSVQTTVGYGNKSGFTATVGASMSGFTVYGGYNSNAGWMAGGSFGLGPLANIGGVNISSNITNIGINYSQKGDWSFNYMGLYYNKGNVGFNPNVGASLPISFHTSKYEGRSKAAYRKDSPFKNEKEMLDDLKAKGFTPGKHKINKYIYEEWDGNSTTLGQTKAWHVGNKLTYLSITLWPHETIDMFYESFNHELIHAYDYAKYGPVSRSYTETKAYRWTDRFTLKSSMPESIPRYNGPMNLFDIPNYLVPTKIPLIPIPPISLLRVY